VKQAAPVPQAAAQPPTPPPAAPVAPVNRTSVQRPSPAPAAKPSGPQTFTTVVKKGEHGIGLDLGRNKDGAAVVLKLKDLPGGAPNPAAQCSPPIMANDVIMSVNGQSSPSFGDAVKYIRAAVNEVSLTIYRA
jgi:C-terminal processing protease CtpA/Prc